MLIDRGADPYDTQALYNTSITRDDTSWLDILWTQSELHGRLGHWTAVPETAIIGGAVPLNALDYLLGNAVASNHVVRAGWLLTRGANANGLHAYSKRPQREEALACGYEEMATLLERFGAEATPLEGQAAFQSACMRLDHATARAIAAIRPECLSEAEPMLTAARGGRADVVALLLELGVGGDVADETQQRGLHNAVAGGSLDVVKLLVAHGADVDRPTTRYGSAMDFAAHFDRREIAAFLAPFSCDAHSLTNLGFKVRLGELFAADPSLVNARHFRFGFTPLFVLPADEDDAIEMAAFLLAHGADPKITNREGMTAEQALRQHGLIEVADFPATKALSGRAANLGPPLHSDRAKVVFCANEQTNSGMAMAIQRKQRPMPVDPSFSAVDPPELQQGVEFSREQPFGPTTFCKRC